MNRRNFLKSSSAAIASTAVLGTKAFAQAPAGIYDRSVHFVYGIHDRKTLDNIDRDIQNALNKVTNGVTCLCPFFLNTMDPLSNSNFTNMLSWVSKKGITLVPGVGYPARGHTLNNRTNIDMARGYFKLGTHIRLENLSGFYRNPNGEQDVKGFIDRCIQIGFTNIMLNPWPVKNGNLMTFNSDQMKHIDSTFQNVNRNTWELNPNPIKKIIGIDPSIPILVNYESPRPQQKIGGMTIKDQEAVFKKTLKNLATFPRSDHLHWAPPFTQSYDPLDPGTDTWDFIARKLSGFQG
jgi:hypothetical protein